MEVVELLKELSQELSDKRGLFSKKIDLDKCLSIVEQLKIDLPNSLAESKYIMDNTQKIMDNADNVAKNTIREAEERAEHIIENSEIAKRAEIEAKKIIETAYMQCDTLIERTKDHLDVMFKEVEQFLQSTLSMIRNNREELRGSMITKR